MAHWDDIEAKAIAKTNELGEALQAYDYRGHELEQFNLVK